MITWTPNLQQWFKGVASGFLGPVRDFSVTEAGDSVLALDRGLTIRFSSQSCCFEHIPTAPDYWRPATQGIPTTMSDLPLIGRGESEIPVAALRESELALDYDFPGLVVWSLLRLEESRTECRDSHGRFPASSSYFFKSGLLQRPVIDEWFFVLRHWIAMVRSGYALPELTPSLSLSCDIDSLSRYAYLSWPRLLRQIVADVLKRRDWLAPLRGVISKLQSGKRLSALDPANQFDWMMREADERGLKITFYMLCDGVSKEYDGDYRVDFPESVRLIRRIEQNGHITGIHPSYTTIDDYPRLDTELALLRKAYALAGVDRTSVDARMHFLRFSGPETLQQLDARGIESDSTLGYAEMPGFRCGTCHPFVAFDLKGDRSLRIVVRPLIAMEKSVVSPAYMNLGLGAEALAQFMLVRKACKRVCGDFSLLWHNTSLLSNAEKRLLLNVLDNE